ncbi:MAG: adenylate kinase [Bacteroidales bacterium]|nr:adenylate kinase [Bacteroidales bacterium]
MLNIAIFGAPGVGKGTQSAFIEKKYNLIHISTGDILREEISKGTELGMLAKSFMDKGQLIPDDVIINILEKIVDKNLKSEGILYDGFPRTVKQAEALDVMFEKKGIKLDSFLCLTADHDTLVARLLNRAKDSGRSDDADVNVIENRIKVYNESTLPVADYYKKQNKCVEINGIGKIEDIFAKICTEIDKVK